MFSEENRVSETRNRRANIVQHNYPNKYFVITLVEKGRLITREYTKEATNLTAARRIAREWCL